jgi:hypothetical protein
VDGGHHPSEVEADVHLYHCRIGGLSQDREGCGHPGVVAGGSSQLSALSVSQEKFSLLACYLNHILAQK